MLLVGLGTRFVTLPDLNSSAAHLSCLTSEVSVVLVLFVRAGGLRMLHADLELLQSRRELEVVPRPALCFGLYDRAVSAVVLALRRSGLDYGMSHSQLYVLASQ